MTTQPKNDQLFARLVESLAHASWSDKMSKECCLMVYAWAIETGDNSVEEYAIDLWWKVRGISQDIPLQDIAPGLFDFDAKLPMIRDGISGYNLDKLLSYPYAP